MIRVKVEPWCSYLLVGALVMVLKYSFITYKLAKVRGSVNLIIITLIILVRNFRGSYLFDNSGEEH